MAILKFINDEVDFIATTGSQDTWVPYFSSGRVEGWQITLNETFAATWPSPVGSTVWMHFIMGWGNSNPFWDENDFFRLEDANGNLVMSSDIRAGVIDWNLFGDSTDSLTYRNLPSAVLVHDIEFVKNGTTDITATVYVNGTFQGTLTAANVADKGVPISMSMTNLDTSSGGSIFFGECVIADEDTRGWRMYQLKPAAFGVNQQWDGEAPAVVDGSLLTGISTDVLNERTSFGLTRIENVSDSALIDRICIQTYGQRGASGLTSFNHYFRFDGGTTVDDADIALGLTADFYIDEYATNPNTALAWEVVDIQGMQIGVRGRT